MKTEIYLPGGWNQYEFLRKNINPSGFKILIIGPGTAPIAEEFRKAGNDVQIIVNDYDSLMETKIELNDTSIPVRIMEYDTTDFNPEEFNLIYAQASVSSLNRNKIIKEVKRLLKPGAYFCAGEIIKLNPDPPKFVTDIWERSELLPLTGPETEKYYTDRQFEVIAAEDQSGTLKKFYTEISKRIQQVKTGQEKGSMKKAMNLYSHETNAYLKLGGDKYMGFKSLLLRKR